MLDNKNQLPQSENEATGLSQQQPTTPASSNIDYGDIISTTLQNQKKKRNPRRIILLCVVIAIAAIFLFQYIFGLIQGPAPTYSQLATVAYGDINQTLSTSGVVQSSNTHTVYSPASAPISELNITLGEGVNSGDTIVMFNTTDLARNAETANASLQQTYLQQQQSNQNSSEASESAQDYQESLNNIQDQRVIAQNNLATAQQNLATVSARLTPDIVAKNAQLESLRTQQTALLASDPSAAAALQPQIDTLAVEISGLEGQLSAANGAVAAAQADVEYHTGLISQLETALAQAEAGVLDSIALAQLQQQLVAPQNSFESANEQLNAALQGVQAPISGVVTAVQVSEGAMVQQYTPICTIQSLEHVEVQLSLSHYDLEQVRVGQSATVTILGNTYNGTLSSINQMATEQATQTGSSSFIGAKVTITNPDANITLGLDATVDIHTGEAQNTLIVPTTAINTDVDGTYTMISENGIATRRSVETGLSSDTMIEVLSGLSEGEVVLLSSQDITEGTRISDDSAYNTQAGFAPPMMMG